MSARRWVSRMAAAALILTPVAPVFADPWIPAAGAGSVGFAIRQFDATQAFLPGQYGTSTVPASELRYSMLRITGEHGLGHGLSIEYDLRAAHVQKIRTRHGRRLLESSVGVEDQEVGLNIGLTRGRRFADSMTLNVVVATGSATSHPALGTGHAAVEPDFQAGLAGSRWRISLKTGPRVFVDGGAAQMRAELEAGVRISRRIELGGVLFYVRTLAMRHPLPATDSAERYDLLRPGLRLEYRISERFKPFIEYEQDVAGQAIHAGRRISAGVSYAY